MKKMIMGLALCLGMSQVVAADTTEISLSDKEVKGAMAWIKEHPRTVAAIAAGLVTAGYVGYNIRSSNVEGKWARTKDGLHSAFINPLVSAKNGVVGAAAWTKNKAYAGKDLVCRHPWAFGVPTAVVAVIAAFAIADYATTDKEAETRIKHAWKKLFSKKAENPVVA